MKSERIIDHYFTNANPVSFVKNKNKIGEDILSKVIRLDSRNKQSFLYVGWDFKRIKLPLPRRSKNILCGLHNVGKHKGDMLQLEIINILEKSYLQIVIVVNSDEYFLSTHPTSFLWLQRLKNINHPV